MDEAQEQQPVHTALQVMIDYSSDLEATNVQLCYVELGSNSTYNFGLRRNIRLRYYPSISAAKFVRI